MTTHRMAALAALLIFLGSAVCGTAVWADEYQEGSRLYKEGKRAEALDRLNSFLAQHPKDARARFLTGVILTEQNKIQDAIKVFTELTQDYPELPEPYNNLAVLYAGLGDYDKARKSLEMAIRTHPSYAVAHENLGDIYATLASQAYDKALQLDSSNATARKKLALIKELFPVKSAATLAEAEPAKVGPEAGAAKAVAVEKAAQKAPEKSASEKSAAEKPAPAEKPAAKPAADDPRGLDTCVVQQRRGRLFELLRTGFPDTQRRSAQRLGSLAPRTARQAQENTRDGLFTPREIYR